MHVLIIDNYDSFTYNLYQYIGELLTQQAGSDFKITVKRNNEITLEQAQKLAADRLIISPGPGSPDDPEYFGVCADVITQLGKTIPLLGVCLGMQGITHCFGGKIVRAPIPMHGKTSLIAHDNQGVYHNIPQQLEIMRYHSLMAESESIPDCLAVTSVVSDNNGNDINTLVNQGCEIMGVRHKEYPIEGIQYHPESFATEGGKKLLLNFLENKRD